MGKKDSRVLPARLCLGLCGVLASIAVGIPASAPASFSGQNGRIFFEGPQLGSSGPADVFSINPDGSGVLDSTFENGFSEERPAASADGQHVVFQTFRDEGWNIFSTNADGSNPTNLTNTKHPVINFEPGWSPDGSKVVFMRQAGGDQDLWAVDANGSGAVDLTEGATNDETAPEFSPDGTKIVYIGAGPIPCPCPLEYNNDIWVMNANGTGQTQLTHTDYPTQNIAPAWSPDGSKIVYSTTESPGGADNGIHVMDASGANQHRLLPGGVPVLAGNSSWSPDGTKIVYESGSGGSLSIMNPDGSESTPLVSNSGARYPSWVPAATASGGGSSTPPPATGSGSIPVPAPLPTPPAKKALVCKKGFKKKVLKGKPRCVRKHKKHKGPKA
jgi:Tol biopolymer transport system component